MFVSSAIYLRVGLELGGVGVIYIYIYVFTYTYNILDYVGRNNCHCLLTKIFLFQVFEYQA